MTFAVKLKRGAAAALPYVCLVAAFLLLNCPFWWLQRENFLVRPWLNIELLLPFLLLPYSRLSAGVLLGLLWTLDLAVAHSATFHFNSALEFIRSAFYLSGGELLSVMSPARLWLVLPLTFCAIGAARIFEFGRFVKAPWFAVLLLMIGIAAADVLNGSSILSRNAVRLFDGNPAGSPSFSLVVRAIQSSDVSRLNHLPKGSSATEIVDVAAWASSHPDESIVLVIIESMGWHRDARMRHWLTSILDTEAMRQRFKLSEHEVHFSEATTSAELRELCGLKGSYRAVDAATGADCLPNRLAAQGWDTIGFHGFSGRMFDRSTWWHHVGLKRVSFGEELVAAHQGTCGGGFSGACDSQVILKALQAAREGHRFIYVLTLNSHLPLAPTPVPADLANLCRLADAGKDVCQLTATVGTALSAIAENLDAVDPHSLVIVVGDHSPPFGDLNSRDQFSQKNVPGYVLNPRGQ